MNDYQLETDHDMAFVPDDDNYDDIEMNRNYAGDF